MATKRIYWSSLSYELHEKYGLGPVAWKAWPSWNPIVSGEWEIRRNIRLESAREDLRDCLRFHKNNRFKLAQINYNSYLENLYKADFYNLKLKGEI